MLQKIKNKRQLQRNMDNTGLIRKIQPSGHSKLYYLENPYLQKNKNVVEEVNILNKKITFTESTDNKKRIITLSFKLNTKPTTSEIEQLNNLFEIEKTKSLDMWEVSKDKLNWKIILD